MFGQVSRTEFTFAYSDEPHATRRKLILQKYPQVKKLMGVDKNFKWQVVALVFIQFTSFYLLRNVKNFWTLAFLAYCFGGVINHALMLAVHELSHAMGFGPSRPIANKALGMFANLPIGLPMSISFKKYHLDHHRYQGDELLDTDVPTFLEALLFRNIPTKILWLILQPFFYTLRPFFVNPKPVEKLELVNIILQLTFDFIIYKTCGIHVVYYMLGGSALAMGLHPVAGHFISEHFLIFPTKDQQKNVTEQTQLQQTEQQDHQQVLSRSNGKVTNANGDINQGDNHLVNNNKPMDKVDSTLTREGQFLVPETCSYYGPLNWVTFHVGYHVEHHDFPSIPGSRLHQLQKIAPEFYTTLNYHTSWIKVLWQYITDPRVGPSARVRRVHDSAKYTSSLKS